MLALREHMHGLEPEGQRQFGVLEDGPGLGTGLLAALLTLKDPTSHDGAVFPATTDSTYKPIRPSGIEQGHEALPFCPIEGVELAKGQPLLELNLVFDLGKHAGKLHPCLKYGSIRVFSGLAPSS